MIIFKAVIYPLNAKHSFQPPALLMAMLIAAAAAFSGQMLYDGGSDILTRHLVRGTFCDPLFYFPSFGFYLGSSNILQLLYQKFPGHEWFDGFTVFCLGILLYSVWIYSAKWNRLQRGLCLLLMIPVLLFPEMTKSSTLLSFLGASFLWMHRDKKALIHGNLLLLLAFSIRTEGGFLGIALMLFTRLAELDLQAALSRQRLKSFSIPIAAWMLLNAMIVNIPFTEMDRAYIPLRGYQFALWDFGYQFEKSGIADQRKSMIIEAGLNHFFGDPAYLNADHFKAAGVRAKDKTMGSMLAYFSSPDTMLRKLFARISQFQNLLAASLILLLSQLRSRRNGMILIAYLASICFFAAFMKLERHLIVPITLCLMLAMSSQNKLINPRNSPLRLILILPWFVTFFMDFSQRKSENHNMQNRLESLQQIPENTLIYFDLYTLVKTHICLFSKPEPIEKWRSFDNAFIFLYPDWRTQFQLASANWDFYQLTTKLKSRPESVYIFHRGKQQFFSRYAEEMYNEKLHWNQISNWSEMSTGVYELQSK